MNRAPTERCTAATPRSHRIGTRARIAMTDGDVLGCKAESVSCNLGESGLMALAMRLRTNFDDHCSIGLHLDARRLIARFYGNAPGCKVWRAMRGLLNKKCEPNAHFC